MAQRYGGKIVTNGLVLCLDAHDAKSYAGEPTQNYVINTSSTGGWWGDGSSQTGLGSKGAVAITDENLKYNGYDTVLWTPGTSRNCYLNSTEDFNYSETSTEWTFSAYLKYEDGSTISSMSVYMYYPSSDGSGTGTVTDVGGGWYRVRRTRTGSSNYISLAGFTGIAAMKKIYISGWQLEKKQYTTPVTSPATSRSATDGWKDLSTNDHDGSLLNGTNTGVSHYRDGQVIMPVTNSYLEFDGSDDQITIANSSSYNNTSSKTVEMWVRAGTGVTGKFNVICTNRSSSDTDVNFAFYLDDRKVVRPWNPSGNDEMVLFYEIGNGSSTFDAFSKEKLGTTTGDDLWHCVVGVTDTASSKIFLYYDGEYVAEKSFSGTPNVPSANLRIGSGYGATDTTYPFSGKYGLFRIYNKALTAAEILSNYNTIKPRFGL